MRISNYLKIPGFKGIRSWRLDLDLGLRTYETARQNGPSFTIYGTTAFCLQYISAIAKRKSTTSTYTPSTIRLKVRPIRSFDHGVHCQLPQLNVDRPDCRLQRSSVQTCAIIRSGVALSSASFITETMDKTILPMYVLRIVQR